MQFLRRKQGLIGCRTDLPKPAVIEGTWRAVLMPSGGEGVQE